MHLAQRVSIPPSHLSESVPAGGEFCSVKLFLEVDETVRRANRPLIAAPTIVA
jgi:hypothetical protein